MSAVPKFIAARRGWRQILAALLRRPQRSVLLPTLAALIGAALAGFGMLHAAPDSTAVPPGYVALVNNKGILLSDFQAQTASVTGKPFAQTTRAERDKTLHDMIDEELLVQRGVALDLPETTTEVRDVMTAAVNAQIDAGTRAQRPTDAQLQEFYQAHVSAYSTMGSMTLRDLVLHVGGYQDIDQSTAQAETDAAEAIYQLRSGAPVDSVMQHFGMVDSGRADQGEALDFAAKLHLGPKLYQVAETLTDGQVSDPVPDSDGVHVLVMERRYAPRAADFAAVRAKVYTDYMDAAAKRAQEAGLKILRRDAHIIMAPGIP
jgi:parvulin-like peptidyl-prolyl isomerase